MKEEEKLYHAIIELEDYCLEWTSEDDLEETVNKRVFVTLEFIGTIAQHSCYSKESTEAVQQILEIEINRSPNNKGESLSNIYQELSMLMVDCTEFITIKSNDEEFYSKKYKIYQDLEALIAITKFLINPCYACKLRALAWLIRRSPYSGDWTFLLSIVASRYVHIVTVHGDPACSSQAKIGNSWLHRLGVFLLKTCSDNNEAPPIELVDLIAAIPGNPTASVKNGKALRMLNYMEAASKPEYMHEQPSEILVGTYLALELLGVIDANRQFEHFNKIEKAVSFYAMYYMNHGCPPSVNKLQNVSELSWLDAKNLMNQNYFSKMVFEYQYKFILHNMHGGEF
ncbi:hypothetical protein [Sneathiella aquimaris]|uniref:hypothetical protein n=1 Tax=Sneathiella aquimaris TaxID=2599305 RepID=UPI001469EABC|nr:hypothetical protein [Sneathiella aquimaris]